MLAERRQKPDVSTATEENKRQERKKKKLATSKFQKEHKKIYNKNVPLSLSLFNWDKAAAGQLNHLFSLPLNKVRERGEKETRKRENKREKKKPKFIII